MSARATCMYCGASGIGPTMAKRGMCLPCFTEYQLEVRRAELVPGIERSFTVDDIMATPGGREIVTRDVVAPRQARIEELLAE